MNTTHIERQDQTKVYVTDYDYMSKIRQQTQADKPRASRDCAKALNFALLYSQEA